jgi:hypothetical protein
MASSRSSSFSTTPVTDEEEGRKEPWHQEQESYQALVADGGHPSHPTDLGFDVIDNPGKYEQYKDIFRFWYFKGTTFHSELQHQLIEWREFREYHKECEDLTSHQTELRSTKPSLERVKKITCVNGTSECLRNDTNRADWKTGMNLGRSTAGGSRHRLLEPRVLWGTAPVFGLHNIRTVKFCF